LAAINSYRDLKVWQAAIALAKGVYQLTGAFPQYELYGLTTQARRAAVSIAANIAEGHGRETTGAFVQFLRVAQGSLKELETHLILAEELGLTGGSAVATLLGQCDEIGRMLRALVRSLQEKARE
jgi:four helix bundle protein